MGRRRLPRSERQARHQRRLGRLAERRSRRDRREGAEARLRAAAGAYVAACLVPEGLRGERCVCERCGLEQEVAMGLVGHDGAVAAAECPGFEGVGCGSAYAVTTESFSE